MEQIGDLPPAETQAMIDDLVAHSTRDEFVYRDRWRPHGVHMWDNRCTMHVVTPYDSANVRRVMHRTARLRERRPWFEPSNRLTGRRSPMEKKKRDEATTRVKDFYDGPADTIYKTTFGENLHLGFPREAGGSHHEAMEHATELMAAHASLNETSRVLDLGSGYGAPARYLVSQFGCEVTGLNVSTVEIEEAERQTRTRGLESSITFDYGDFHELPYSDDSFDVVWSQDSLMYGADKRRILEEVERVLKPGGVLDFTDILAPRDLDVEDRNRLYERVRTPEMWDTERYLVELIDLNFKIRRVEDWSEHVAASYAWVRRQVIAKRDELESKVGAELVQRTMDGLEFWVDMAERGNVGWVLLVARKPS